MRMAVRKRLEGPFCPSPLHGLWRPALGHPVCAAGAFTRRAWSPLELCGSDIHGTQNRPASAFQV